MEWFTRERWSDLWSRIKACGDPNLVYDDLVRRYSASPRVYHTVEHIDFCYGGLDAVLPMIQNPNAVEFALAVHDVEKTEELSAQHAIVIAGRAKLRKDFIRTVVGLVHATDHKIIFADNDKRFIMDIDLRIFGQSIEAFDRYDAQIREEYRHFSDEEYRRGRLIVLNKFLVRGARIYSTKYFQNKYGDQAKANLLRAIARLQ